MLEEEKVFQEEAEAKSAEDNATNADQPESVEEESTRRNCCRRSGNRNS